jgi:hypothetical protein
MELDELLRETGARWRAAQPGASDYDLGRRVAPQRPPRRQLRWATALVAATVLLGLVGTAWVAHRVVAEPAATPLASPTAPGDLVGQWYASVSRTQTRSAHADLVGDWMLVLDATGKARLSQFSGPIDVLSGPVDVTGSWRMSGSTVTFTLPVPGCAPGDVAYRVVRSALHPELLELTEVPGSDSCVARTIVLDGHWTASPASG